MSNNIANLGQLDIDDVSERALGIVGNANLKIATRGRLYPLMLLPFHLRRNEVETYLYAIPRHRSI
ncbi:MAG: hypothetical protein ACKOFJ_08050, partial [Actinomycetota bacterium]